MLNIYLSIYLVYLGGGFSFWNILLNIKNIFIPFFDKVFFLLNNPIWILTLHLSEDLSVRFIHVDGIERNSQRPVNFSTSAQK